MHAQTASQKPDGPIRVSTDDGSVSFEGIREFVFPANQVRITGRKATVFTKYGLASSDIPDLDAAKITTGLLARGRLCTGTADATTFCRGDGVWAAAPAAPVTSVFGRTGAVVAQSNDYNFNQLAGTAAPSQLPAATVSAQGAMSAADKAKLDSVAGGATASIDNSASESVLGANFTLNAAANTYQDTGLAVSLPSAGTYVITADVRGNLTMATGTVAYLAAKLYNATDAADVADSERFVLITFDTTNVQLTAPLHKVVTVGGAKTIKLYAMRSYDGSITQSLIISNSDGRTALSYLKVSN